MESGYFFFDMNNKNRNLTREVAENCCRTCLEQKDLKPIFAINYERKPVADLLFYCIALKVEENYKLPDKICSSCFGELIRIFAFKQKSHATTKILENCLNKFEAEKISKQEKLDKETKAGDSEEILIEPQLRKTNKLDNNFSYSTNESKSLIDLSEFQLHFKKSVKSRSLTCKVCTMEFGDSNSLKTHKKEMKHVDVKNHTCLVCNKTFTKSKLKQHMRIHTKEKPYQCKKCFKRFSMVWNLNRHMMGHTGEKPFICDICGKEHKRTHTGDAPYVCSYCGKRFIRSSRHKAHLKVHLLERQKHLNGGDNNPSDSFHEENRCPTCSRLYASKGTLRMHMLRHGEKTLLCSDCGKKFYTKNNLISHSKVHKGEKLYVCKECNKTFTFSSALKTHMLVHTSQKPYTCKICSKSFKQHHHLKYHLRVHSGEKPYSCTCCGKTFALNTNLTVHLRTHTGETPYVCSVCDIGYNRLNNMKVHQATHKHEQRTVDDFLKVNTAPKDFAT
ncbi:zinc finger protein OZF-like isoform X2 [Agrilus planipennis]|uniref:Zinc finger protein OZF-like isoform X2 n=1 Tax=Agrilus planipennis TaxID=224129 RepID=A0A1W4WJR0_AGRPL|nr:zinc finger protein OZF-like isoform X2 [Agrilus planipennis]